LRFIDAEIFDIKTAVPTYYDMRFDESFHERMNEPKFKDFQSMTLGELVEKEIIEIKNGHGSPSADQRVGDVPYIKVSDLRAGLVNINPTNRVPEQVAKKFWKKGKPDLQAFDILSPERTSKNIGDFCVLMPGQEKVLLTKEIIVMRPGKNANFDSFYLIWAMSLKIVRDQWKRVVFMQTNREDVGKRYYEISIPVPKSSEAALSSSKAFRDYYITISEARTKISEYLNSCQDHHFFVSGTEHEKEDEENLIAAKAPDDE
jgi:type I restriction enzyme M protein